MFESNYIQLSQTLEDKKPQTILPFVKNIFTDYYKNGDFKIVVQTFFKVKDLFEGKFLNYAHCDTPYHDYNHTLDVFLATARILDGYLLKNSVVPVNMVTNCLLAALLHDVGYIMKKDDNSGTGAKYTVIHVDRGIAFIKKHYKDLGIGEERLDIIGGMIKATQIGHKFDDIQFATTLEKTMAAIVASADLVGQMSNRDYLERLIFLYFEFKEANLPGYNTEFDILRRTFTFYEITKKRLKEDLKDVSSYCRDHFALRNDLDIDLYKQAILGQMEYLKKVIDDESTNFRNKLHRGDWLGAQAI